MIHYQLANFLNKYSLRIVTEPSIEQVTLEEAYLHLRMDAYGSPPAHPEDAWLADNISTAREWCEGYSGRMLAPQVMSLSLTRFPTVHDYSRYQWPPQNWYWETSSQYPPPIDLKVCPVVGIESIVYVDGDGNSQTLDPATYILDNKSEPCLVYPAHGSSWPTVQTYANAVTVTFHAGHTMASGSPNDYPLPKRYKSAMLLVLGHLYENREQTVMPERVTIMEIPLGAAELMQRDMIRMGMA